MAIESDIKDLEQEILDAIGGYRDTVPKQLAALVSNLQSELKAGRFKNRRIYDGNRTTCTSDESKG